MNDRFCPRRSLRSEEGMVSGGLVAVGAFLLLMLMFGTVTQGALSAGLITMGALMMMILMCATLTPLGWLVAMFVGLPLFVVGLMRLVWRSNQGEAARRSRRAPQTWQDVLEAERRATPGLGRSRVRSHREGP